MSRCFPYPPPGYLRKVASTEAALIESIKLQSERRQSKNDRKIEKSKHKKEKSKDKKERSKDKKHKSKERKEKSSHSRDSNDLKQKECLKEGMDLLNGTKVEAEQLERSGLTEEHGQPVWPHSPGYLSDGTQTNHKRKRDTELQPDEGCKLGKIIRIKLATPSSSQQEDSSAGSDQACSTSGRDNAIDQKRDENSCGSIQQIICFTDAETAVAINNPTSSKPKIKDLPLHAVKDVGSKGNVATLPPRTRSPAESAYEALFEKWVAPPLHLEQQTDDEEWLFGRTRKQDGQSTMTNNKAFSSVPSCGRILSLWPRGQHLADADVYSLPYTIPF